MIKYDGSRAPEGHPRDDIIIAPFGDWQKLSAEEVDELVPGFDPESDLGPGSRREIVIRMLRNLASDYEAVGQADKATRTLKCLDLL